MEEIKKTKNEGKMGRKWYTVAGAIVVFSLLIVVMLYAIFCFVFPSTKVVGVSMKPSLNNYVELVDGKDDAFYEESEFQDTIYVNRFNKGSVGDIIALNKDGKNVVKRIIATRIIAEIFNFVLFICLFPFISTFFVTQKYFSVKLFFGQRLQIIRKPLPQQLFLMSHCRFCRVRRRRKTVRHICVDRDFLPA